MNVYFVNRYSKIKGPFAIIDSNRQHIIKVGDICLRDTINGITFLVVYGSTNTWNACKLVGIGKKDVLPDIGNSLLFSFDGLSKRKGDVALIKQITPLFREKVIDDFFRNAVDILEYKKDYWDGSLFPQFFASSQELIVRDEQEKTDVSIDSGHYPSFFAQYLTKELQELLKKSLDEGYGLKESYLILRKKHPELFRKALMQFLIENPNGTIYDKPADVFVPIVTEVESPKKISRNDIILEADEKIDEAPSEINKRIEIFLSEIGRQELLSIDDEIELAAKVRRGETDARNKLVSANMRYVVGLVKQYLHKGLDFEDLLQESFQGLIKAAEHFDETRGFSFIHYAPWWIKRYLNNAVVNKSSLIRFPMNVQVLHRKIWDSKIRYENQNGFLPPITEIEVVGDEDLDKNSFLDSIPANLRNTCISSEDLDVFEDNHNDILDYEDKEENKYYVRSFLAYLSERERNILIRVFGIGVKEETLESIGKAYGLTRERVRQIKEKAIKKLRVIVRSASNRIDYDKKLNRKDVDTTKTAIIQNNSLDTQSVKDVKRTTKVFSSETSLKSLENGADHNTNYEIVNYNGKCCIYNHKRIQVYSSVGCIKEMDNYLYRMSFTPTMFRVRHIKRNNEGMFFNGQKIITANSQSPLYRKLEGRDFLNFIEDVKNNGKKRIKVDGCWYDERGYELILKTNSNPNINEQKEVAKESIEENNTRNSETPNDIDVFGVEHVFVNTFDSLPYRDVEVEIEQPDIKKSSKEKETHSIGTYAENIRFSQRSKQFLNSKCRVGLSKTGYYLIINHKFIKLGDYPKGYDCNVGHIWIKRPIEGKGYLMIHEKEKGYHLIGYVIEKDEKVELTNSDKDVYTISFDGRIASGDKNKNKITAEDIDYLQHTFDKKATSYKYFWFLAILKRYKESGDTSILYKDILIKMASIAWSYVFMEKCEFPKIDQLPRYLETIDKKIESNESTKGVVIDSILFDYYDKWELNTLLSPLLKNVPYRFLSPWVPFTDNDDVVAKSNDPETRCPYALHDDYITINPIWGDYFLENYDKLTQFAEHELRLYLKIR